MLDNKVYPILSAYDKHNRGEIRIKIILGEKETTAHLDLTKNRYNSLQQDIFHENGTVKL